MAHCKVNAMAFATMVRMLVDGPHTAHEIVEETGLHYVTVARYLREMHRAGAVHVSAWEKDSRGRDQVKVFSLGRKRDTKRARMTQAERQRAYKERLRQRELLRAFAGMTMEAA